MHVLSPIAKTFLRSFARAGFFKEGTISQQVREMLAKLEYQDLLLTPASLQDLGINNPTFFGTLNIGGVRIISPVAKEHPELLGPVMAGIAEAATPMNLYRQITGGIKSGLIAVREQELREKPDVFNEHLDVLAEERKSDIEVTDYQKDFEHGRMGYLLKTTDEIKRETFSFPANVIFTTTGEGKQVTVNVLLPWNSPNLVAKLNQLLGMPWFYKYRESCVSSSNYHQIQYVWSSFSELIRWGLIETKFKNNSTIVTGINLDFDKLEEEFRKKGEIRELKNISLSHLDKQLQHSIRTFDQRPDLQDVVPEFYWDLGLLRDQLRNNQQR